MAYWYTGSAFFQIPLSYLSMIMTKEILFLFFSVLNAVQRGKAYWHINFSLINGCSTRKNNICGHSFEVALVSSPNIIIVTKKINKNL